MTVDMGIRSSIRNARRSLGGTRDALRHKRGKGERVGNIEIGYRLAVDGVHIEPDPTEQAALAAIRKLRSGGHSLRAVTGALNNSGHRTRRGTHWRLESVVRAINQEAAKGQQSMPSQGPKGSAIRFRGLQFTRDNVAAIIFKIHRSSEVRATKDLLGRYSVIWEIRYVLPSTRDCDSVHNSSVL
jgi:hypothetical protein